MADQWRIAGARKDRQTITARWTPSDMRLIDGVTIREVLHVPKSNGYLTEIFRSDWPESRGEIGQVFQVVLEPGAISAWHAHATTTDRLFVSHGRARIVLHDAREESPTRGITNEFRFGTIRPALIHLPPRIWHGVQNVSDGPAIIINIVDRAYDYEDPDHWRVPADSPEIPFTF
ncbi:MAG: polysaccharide biosynthesis C-terminal domain-containing protein [Thermoanaerobaculia bacterium]